MHLTTDDCRDGKYAVPTWTYTPCASGHTWFYSGCNCSDEIPEGTLCECGKMKAHYEDCPHCGHRIFKAVPINGE